MARWGLIFYFPFWVLHKELGISGRALPILVVVQHGGAPY